MAINSEIMQELQKKLNLSDIGVRKRIDKIKKELKIVNLEVGAYCLAFQEGINISKKKYNLDREIIEEVQSALRGRSTSIIPINGKSTKSIFQSPQKINQKRTITQKTSSQKKYFEKSIRTNILSLIKKSNTVQLSEYKIIGNYVRYDEKVINELKNLIQKIIHAIKTEGNSNFLIWGSPGTGKTYLINQIADSQKDKIEYHELNVAELGQDLKLKINEIEKRRKNCICLIDEIDSDSHTNWVYEFLLPYLLPTSKRKFTICFVLAGSGSGSIDKMKQKIISKNKGKDFLDRIPNDNQYTIQTPNIGDRFLTIASQMLNRSKEKTNLEINKIDKLALFYILVNPKYSSQRQIDQVVTSAVLRVPRGEDRMNYDALFQYGDIDNKEFWLQAKTIDPKLFNSFIHIKKN